MLLDKAQAVSLSGTTRPLLRDRKPSGSSGYLSHSVLPLYFGLDEAQAVDRIEVRWPSGKTQTVPGPIAANRMLDVTEAASGTKP